MRLARHGVRLGLRLGLVVLAACGGAQSAPEVPSEAVRAQDAATRDAAGDGAAPTASASPSPASSSPGDSSPAASPSVDSVAQLLPWAQAALASRQYREAEALLRRATAVATTAPERRQVRYWQATLAAYGNDLPAALRLLDENAAEAEDGETRFWVHNQRTWVRWAQGDAAGALSEVDLADKAAASVKDAHEADLLRLHVLWDRAYLLLDGARTPKERAAAEAVRKEFEALAAKAKNPAGVAVLRAWFASAGGHVAAARKAVAQAGLATTDDIQDVFVGGATLQRAGDPAGAEVFFRKVRESTKPYLMHALLLRRVPPPP